VASSATTAGRKTILRGFRLLQRSSRLHLAKSSIRRKAMRLTSLLFMGNLACTMETRASMMSFLRMDSVLLLHLDPVMAGLLWFRPRMTALISMHTYLMLSKLSRLQQSSASLAVDQARAASLSDTAIVLTASCLKSRLLATIVLLMKVK